MKQIKNNLKRAIIRSTKAYQLYLSNKYYYQALRIYHANQIVYVLLNEYYNICDEVDMEHVLNYIFHLEDWFEQFKQLQKTNPNLKECFVFERFADSPAFPSDFLNLLK